jgi:hypothetical protein
MWWTNGRCAVEILRSGHFPNSVIVKLPNDVQTEVEIDELMDSGVDQVITLQ